MLLIALCLALCCCGEPNTTKGTEGLEYEIYRDGYRVTGYHGEDPHVVIPDTYKGIPVLMIEHKSFEGSDIQSVVIGKNVEEIEYSAFISCVLLKEVYISASVRVIGGSERYNGAFLGCRNLETVTFADDSQLEIVGKYAFNGCDALDLELPSAYYERNNAK